jgi:non-specific serine/threonine protein kinase
MLRVPASDAVFEFGEFRFEPANSRLLRAGEALHAQPKMLRVLAVLLENAGTLVDRDALFDLVWERVVVTPGALTRLIRELRRLLDDEAGEPRFIETVHTRGYRWLAPVTRSGASARGSNLPESTISLIGRDADLSRLDGLIRTARLVTLAGPGGSGKTQLALEFARRFAAESRAVVWVDLSSATDKLHCSRLVAAALDAREREDLALEASLARAIGARELVLLLDNCEVVIHPVVSLARLLLSQCGGLKLLCTSQVTLDVPDESVHWVRPLATPDDAWQRAEDPLAILRGIDSVRLLVERARAVTPEFGVDRDNAPAVAGICRQLDGLPLALELAASRLATLTPAQLLDALTDRFAVLERRVARPEARFRSLAAAIEWSYGLLEPREQEVLDNFGIFAGPFTIEAARAVVGPEGPSGAALLNVVQSLAQKSLLTIERGDREIRYRLLDSVKVFARSRLLSRGIDAEVRRRHADFFIALARDADVALLTRDQVVWLDRLAGAWPDLTAAFEGLLRPGGSVPQARTLVTGLRWFFWIRGMYGEGLQWLRGWRDLAAGAQPLERAALLNGVAISLFHATRFREAEQAAREALDTARKAGSAWEVAFAHSLLDWIVALGEADARRGPLSEPNPAEELDAWSQAFSRMGRAFTRILGGKRKAALAELAAIRALVDQTGERHLTMFSIAQQGLLHYQEGRLDEARGFDLRHVLLSLEISNPRGVAGASELAGYLAISGGDPALGASLLGGAEALREATGAPLFPQWDGPHDTAVGRARRALGEAGFEAARASGRRMGMREIAALISDYHANTTTSLRGGRRTPRRS